MARTLSIVCAATLALSARSLQAAEGSGEILIGSPGPAGRYLESLQDRGSARWERDGEAPRRVQAAPSMESALSLFAAAWLGRALGSPAIAPEAAVALAAAGHHIDESLLQPALRRTELADGLAAAAARAKVAV